MKPKPLPDHVAAAYLERLEVEVPRGGVDTATLATLQRKHVGRFPFENLDIVRGRPPRIDPVASAERLLAGRGGYCFHLNGAFAALLEWLGVDVSLHLAGVERRTARTAPGPSGSHLGVTARTPDGARWLVDVGLGDGPAEPLPLVQGRHTVAGFTYELRRSLFDPEGWRLEHDPTGWVRGVDIASAPAALADFEAMHTELSTAPASGFVRIPVVMRRVEGGIEALRGDRQVTITPSSVEEREVASASAWWELVTDRFGLAYHDLAPDDLARIWSAARAAHRGRRAAARP